MVPKRLHNSIDVFIIYNKPELVAELPELGLPLVLEAKLESLLRDVVIEPLYPGVGSQQLKTLWREKSSAQDSPPRFLSITMFEFINLTRQSITATRGFTWQYDSQRNFTHGIRTVRSDLWRCSE